MASYVPIPPRICPVEGNLADVSGLEDGSHLRAAYGTHLISNEPEHSRSCMAPLRDGEVVPELAEGEFDGFPVDAGTACSVGRRVLGYGMPPTDDWLEKLFDHSGPTAGSTSLRIRATSERVSQRMGPKSTSAIPVGLMAVIRWLAVMTRLGSWSACIDFQVAGPSE